MPAPFPGRERLPAALSGAAGLAGSLAACSRSPSQDIMGSFFPSWLLCLGVGVAAAALARYLLGLVDVAESVPLPTLAYCATALAVTCLVWLTWFGN